MSLVPKISLTLGNKCNLVNLYEETNAYNLTTNPTGWGTPNIDTAAVVSATVNVYPWTYSPAINAFGTGTISGTTFTDVLHLSGTFVVGQYLTGIGVTPGTKIVALITGTGANNGGTYQVNISQSVLSTVIMGVSVLEQFIFKNPTINLYTGQIGNPTPVPFTALVDQIWSQPDGIYQVVYSVLTSTTEYTNDTQHELFLCNLCNCKDRLVVALIDACDSITVKKLKDQVDQMEIFIYGIQSAFACGNFDTAEAILTAASTYCQTIVDCGCGCNGGC
jgi:hypothetical protein